MMRMDGWHYEGEMKKFLGRYAKFLDKKQEVNLKRLLNPEVIDKDTLMMIRSEYFSYSSINRKTAY